MDIYRPVFFCQMSLYIYRAINIFLPVNANLHWLSNVSCLVEYNSLLIKVDFLIAACIALRAVGAVFVIFLRRWRSICTVLQPMGSKGRYLEEMSQTLWTNKKQGKLDEVHAANITVVSQRILALTARNTLFA